MKTTKPVTPAQEVHPGGPDVGDRELYVMTSPRHAIPLQLIQLIQRQVEVVVPVLNFGERYTLEMLCEPAVWAALTIHERRAAGSGMAYLVARKSLPLTFAGRTSGNARFYRLI